MNVSHTKLLRAFSAMSMVIPVSMPTTSLSYHFVNGLKASTKPYRLQACGYLARMFLSTRIVAAG